MNWEWKHFDQLTPAELYKILTARQRVFAVEQNCIYLDTDGLDTQAWHLILGENSTLAGYLRVLPPGTRFKERSMGRVLTLPEFRGKGFGKELVKTGLEKTLQTFGPGPIRISAQTYLKDFYAEFGFKLTSQPAHLEDGIPHIEMIKDLH